MQMVQSSADHEITHDGLTSAKLQWAVKTKMFRKRRPLCFSVGLNETASMRQRRCCSLQIRT